MLMPMISVSSWRPPPIFGGQSLADDVAQGRGEPFAHLRLFALLQHADDPVDGLSCANGVQGGINHMAGFGSRQRGFHRFPIPDFSHENDFWRLAQGGSQAH